MMGHVLFFVGVALNLILVVGLFVDPRARSKTLSSPGPLGPIKQQFFFAKLVETNRSVSCVAVATLVLISALYYQEIAVDPAGAQSEPLQRTEGSQSVDDPSEPSDITPDDLDPIPFRPQVAEEELRYLLGQSVTAREAFRAAAGRARDQLAAPPRTNTPANTQPAYSEEQIEAAVAAVLSLIQGVRRSRAEADERANPAAASERDQGPDFRGLINRAERIADTARQSLSGEGIETEIRSRLEQVLQSRHGDGARETERTGDNTQSAPLPSRDVIAEALRSAQGRLSQSSGSAVSELSEDELRAAVDGVRSILRTRPPEPSSPVPPTRPVVPPEETAIPDLLRGDIDHGINTLSLAVEVWQALTPLAANATPEAKEVMADVERAGEGLRDQLDRIEQAIQSGPLTLGTVESVSRALADPIATLSDAIEAAEALPLLPAPAATSGPAVPTSIATNVATAAPTPPPPGLQRVPQAEGLSDRAVTLTAAVFVCLGALLAFLLASMNFQMRIRSGEFGRHSDEMRKLMAFALKKGLGPTPPAMPGYGAVS